MELKLKFRDQFNITPDQKLFFWGSCFSENISQRLNSLGFNVLSNSHGIIFNPVSLQKAVSSCVYNTSIDENDIVQNQDVYIHLDFHGEFNSLNKEDIIENCNSSIREFNQNLSQRKKSKIFITLGSAWIYEHIESSTLVANCHKLPSSQFNKRMLSINECKQAIQTIQEDLDKVLDDYEIHLTVSPVRHKKDGWVENNLSKSTLLLAINEFVKESDKAFYFPVYEWVIDILRDYSFFTEDGIHPNIKAVDFIFKQFVEHYFDKYNKDYITRRTNINQQVRHRVQLPGSQSHQNFLITLLKQIEKLEKDYRFLLMDSEKRSINKDLEKYFQHES
jgi:hypothetical protein